MYTEEYIDQANAPKKFKLYESRDGMFTDRIGPYFIKGRYPDVTMGIRILEHHSNMNGVSHGGLLMAFCDTLGGYIFSELESKFQDIYKTGLRLHSIKLWETPTSYALYQKD